LRDFDESQEHAMTEVNEPAPTPQPQGASPTARPEAPPAYRWIVLVIISLAMFGNYYIYDCISPLADVLTKQLGFNDSNITLLQAIYSIPNIFMVLIGGIIIDRLGTRKSTLIFALLCLVGAIVTMASPKLSVMAAGRLIFGLGAESLIVAVTTAIAKWFRGKELSFAFGINLTIARFGSFAALNSPTWAREYYQSWQLPLKISVIAGIICVAAAAVYWALEIVAERSYRLQEAGETDKIVFKDIFTFTRSYWFIVALCITFYSAIFPFQTLAVKFFINAHGTSREFGSFLSSVLILFSMIFTPLFGLMVDKVGRRSGFMMFGSCLLIPVYLLMAHTHYSLAPPEALVKLAGAVQAPLSPALGFLGIELSLQNLTGLLFKHFTLSISMALMGIAFSLIPAIMWPSVAYIVEQPKLGTAYGLMTMIQNIGLAAFNLIIGRANDLSRASEVNPGGYAPGMWIFSCLGFFGMLFAFLLNRNEAGPGGHGLDFPKPHSSDLEEGKS
jgi:MFS family permease